jgi:hypothetical protein
MHSQVTNNRWKHTRLIFSFTEIASIEQWKFSNKNGLLKAFQIAAATVKLMKTSKLTFLLFIFRSSQNQLVWSITSSEYQKSFFCFYSTHMHNMPRVRTGTDQLLLIFMGFLMTNADDEMLHRHQNGLWMVEWRCNKKYAKFIKLLFFLGSLKLLLNLKIF